jgi:hypothetical protein
MRLGARWGCKRWGWCGYGGELTKHRSGVCTSSKTRSAVTRCQSSSTTLKTHATGPRAGRRTHRGCGWQHHWSVLLPPTTQPANTTRDSLVSGRQRINTTRAHTPRCANNAAWVPRTDTPVPHPPPHPLQPNVARLVWHTHTRAHTPHKSARPMACVAQTRCHAARASGTPCLRLLPNTQPACLPACHLESLRPKPVPNRHHQREKRQSNAATNGNRQPCQARPTHMRHTPPCEPPP